MTLNYQISYNIANHYKSLGYKVSSDSSKASDYITFHSSEMREIRFTVRISNHIACTSRSECAQVEFTTANLYGYGDLTSEIGFDDDGFVDYNADLVFITKEDRDAHVLKMCIYEIEDHAEFKYWFQKNVCITFNQHLKH